VQCSNLFREISASGFAADVFPSHHEPMIRVGPAGWSYRDWNGVVYPANASRNFDRLVWISKYFDTVEINASFYHIPAPRMAESWTDGVPRGFLFSVKLHRSFTQRGSGTTKRGNDTITCILQRSSRRGLIVCRAGFARA
jgi:uncharacterized protein YecE (DUF72 family)